MRKFTIVMLIMTFLVLAGCSDKGNNLSTDGSSTNANHAGHEQQQNQQQNQQQQDSLAQQVDQLKKGNELFPTFSQLTYDFMIALDNEDLNALKQVVSEKFIVEISGEKWFYISEDMVEGNNKVLLYDDANDIESWYIASYGEIPEFEKYRMSIRTFTSDRVTSNVGEVINIHFDEVGGKWKITSVDRNV